MRILIIGGTGFIGSYTVRHLSSMGHEVTVFHKGKTKTDLPPAVNYILGDRQNLADFASEFKQLSLQVVLDIIPVTEQDAQIMMNTFKGLANRVVAVSSGDVYRAYGVFHGTESGPVEPVPIKEDAPLRQSLYPYRNQLLPQGVYDFLNPDDYDKILVERAVMSNSDLPATILRLPMTHGPRDPLHRLYPYLKRMDDNRPAILLQEDAAKWRGPRGYVENVAAAIALAVVDHHATGRIYNVAEPEALTEAEWVREIGQVVGWNGEVIGLPKEDLPAHLRLDYNMEQQWVVDTTRIREELGYNEPVTQGEALRRTIDWERSHPPDEIPPEVFDYAAEDAVLTKLEQL